jgi:hypothetical protein
LCGWGESSGLSDQTLLERLYIAQLNRHEPAPFVKAKDYQSTAGQV